MTPRPPIHPAMQGLSVRRPALAVIIGRAGSRGVPGKNAMMLAGKPCAQWTIEHALASETIGRVAFSTDDPQLLLLAQKAAIDAIPRAPELASDTATVDSAARDAVIRLDNTSADVAHMPPNAPIVILYANAPVRPSDLVDRAVRLMMQTGCDSVQSYAPVGKMHPWWMARIDADTGTVRPWEGEVLNHGVYRRQDLPAACIPDGGVLVVTRRALFGEIAGVTPGPHAFLGLDRRGVPNNEGDVVDIDSPIDALVAEAMLRQRPEGVEA